MDPLFESIARFPACGIKKRFVLNTMPKSGTMVLRNILLHFLGPQSDYDFLWPHNLDAELLKVAGNIMRVGHLPFSLQTATALRTWQKLLLVRHPAKLFLAQTRILLEEQGDRADIAAFRSSGLSFEALMSLVIDGYDVGGVRIDPFERAYLSLVGWNSMDDVILIDHRQIFDDAAIFRLLLQLEIQVPQDAAARIRAGRERKISSTFLDRTSEYEHFAEVAGKLVEIHAPRALRWYEQVQMQTSQWL